MNLKKILSVAASAVLLSTSLFTAALAETPVENPYARTYAQDFVWSTKGISALKSKAADARGTVESLTYETPAYAVNAVTGGDYTITKSVNVYLPAGYDPAQNYNVLYLMHGGGDDQDFWLTEKSDRTHGKTTTRVLDHMMEDGLCGPVIIVTPTFYADVEGVTPEEEAIAKVVSDIGEPNYASMADLYTWYFADELRNQLIPAVETAYATYANKDVSEESLAASREHRAYAGLSMGSLTSFHSILMRSMDLFAYCGSLSGAKTDEKLFRETIEQDFPQYAMKFWLNVNGVDDIAFQEHYDLYSQLMETMPDKFTDGENCAMVVLGDGAHNYAAWIVGLYNSLLVFFK